MPRISGPAPIVRLYGCCGPLDTRAQVVFLFLGQEVCLSLLRQASAVRKDQKEKFDSRSLVCCRAVSPVGHRS